MFAFMDWYKSAKNEIDRSMNSRLSRQRAAMKSHSLSMLRVSTNVATSSALIQKAMCEAGITTALSAHMLHACRRDDVRALHDLPQTPAAQDLDRFLFVACEHGSRRMIGELIRVGADPLAEHSALRGYTAFHMACLHCPDVIPLMAGHAASATKTSKQTMLHIVFLYPVHADIVRSLVARSDVSARSASRKTPLHHACAFGPDPAMVRELIAAGARIGDRDDRGHNALSYACCHQTLAIQVIPLVYSHECFEDVRHMTSIVWNGTHIRCLLLEDVDVPADDERTPVQKYTYMHIAAAVGNAVLVRKLDRLHPHMRHCKDVFGRTPLDMAGAHPHVQACFASDQ